MWTLVLLIQILYLSYRANCNCRGNNVWIMEMTEMPTSQRKWVACRRRQRERVVGSNNATWSFAINLPRFLHSPFHHFRAFFFFRRTNFLKFIACNHVSSVFKPIKKKSIICFYEPYIIIKSETKYRHQHNKLMEYIYYVSNLLL